MNSCTIGNLDEGLSKSPIRLCASWTILSALVTPSSIIEITPLKDLVDWVCSCWLVNPIIAVSDTKYGTVSNIVGSERRGLEPTFLHQTSVVGDNIILQTLFIMTPNGIVTSVHKDFPCRYFHVTVLKKTSSIMLMQKYVMYAR